MHLKITPCRLSVAYVQNLFISINYVNIFHNTLHFVNGESEKKSLTKNSTLIEVLCS